MWKIRKGFGKFVIPIFFFFFHLLYVQSAGVVREGPNKAHCPNRELTVQANCSGGNRELTVQANCSGGNRELTVQANCLGRGASCSGKEPLSKGPTIFSTPAQNCRESESAFIWSTHISNKRFKHFCQKNGKSMCLNASS
jgi:hypothetical protein